MQEVPPGIGAPISYIKIDRLGKIREDGKLRPMRIRMQKEEDKLPVIRNAPKIRKAWHISFDTVTIFITPDTTKPQREQDFNLRKSLSENQTG